MNKKVLLLGYVRKNVGDDLFISMLLNRYKKIKFILIVDKISFCDPFLNYKNLEIYETSENILKDDLSNISACIYVGGSIFIENENSISYRKTFNKFIRKCKKLDIPFFYLSSNFGPYKTNEFYNLCRSAFKNIKGITFRDKNSYEKFKNIASVRYVPDLVFSLSLKKGKKIKNSIGISLIDLGLPARGEDLNSLELKYLAMLKNNIEKFINMGKEIYLYSFCEREGDLRFIKKLLGEINEYYLKKIKIVEYNGENDNLYKFIRMYSRMEKVICTRFHSLVMSLVFKQEIAVVSYSNKLDNLLEDINYDFNIVKIDQNIDKIIIKMDSFKKIDKKILKNYRKNSVGHFKMIDDSLKFRKLNNKVGIKKLSLKNRLNNKKNSYFNVLIEQ